MTALCVFVIMIVILVLSSYRLIARDIDWHGLHRTGCLKKRTIYTVFDDGDAGSSDEVSPGYIHWHHHCC